MSVTVAFSVLADTGAIDTQVSVQGTDGREPEAPGKGREEMGHPHNVVHSPKVSRPPSLRRREFDPLTRTYRIF